MPLLQIDIEARYARFQDALTSIERQTQQTAANLSSSFEGVKSTLGGLGAAISVGALAAVVKTAIDAADNLDDLSKRTGIAVDTLGGLGFAAEQAGGNLDSIAGVADKLNKAIAGAGSGNREFVEGFQALGIGIKDAEGNLKTVDKVLIDIANKFEGYADGPEKVALATRLLGKSGAEQIALLNDGGKALQENIEYYKRYSGVTAQVAADSGAFNDTLAKLSLLAGGAGQTIAAQLLGPLQEVAKALLDAREKSGAFETIGKVVGTAFEALVIVGANVAFTFGAVGREIGGIAAQLDRLAHGDFKGFTAIGDAMKVEAQLARTELDAFEDRILNRKPKEVEGPPGKPKPKPKPRAPALDGAGDPASRILDAQLKALERQSQAEQQLLATRSDFLQSYYQADLLSISQYYEELRGAQAKALKAQEANIAKEIALLTSRKPKDAREEADRDAKVEDLKARRSALRTAASQAGIKSFIEEDRAARAFAATLTSINAELLEQQGLLPQAAAIRFDQANAPDKQRITVERDAALDAGDTVGAAALDADLGRLAALRNLTIAQAKLNSFGEIGFRVQADLSEATERAQISAQLGSIGELESLRIVSDARLQAVADLQQVATAFADIANSTGDPRSIQQARALQLEVDKLAASADLVRERFQDAFAGPFESALDRMISGTASLKDVLKGLFSDVASELTKIATQDLSKQIFSKNGAFGGAVDFASGIFGGRPGTATPSANVAGTIAQVAGGGLDTAATTAGFIALNATLTPVTAAMGSLVFAAESAALALASVTTSGAADSAEGIFNLASLVASRNGNIFAGGNVVPFAKGGIPAIVSTPTLFPMNDGRTGLMGEAGPEAIMPLARNPAGQLSVTAIGERGRAMLLPLARDANGRMAVQAQPQVKAFAKGGVFGGGGALERAANQSFGMRADVVTQAAAGGKGDTNMVVQVTPPVGSSTASATQWGAAAGRQIQNSLRRNG